MIGYKKLTLKIYLSFLSLRYDLTFNMTGYIMVFISDIATALNGVYTMKKLQAKVVKYSCIAIACYHHC